MVVANFFGPTDQSPLLDRSYGPLLPTPKPTNTFRIMSQNLNGVPASQIDTKFSSVLSMCLEHETSILLFQEHNLDVSQLSIRQQLRASARAVQSWPHVHLNVGTSTTTSVSAFKPGGTGIATLSQLKRQMEPGHSCQDPMGRWTRITFRRPGQRLITILSCYQVCPRPTNATGNTAYHQQLLLLREDNRQVHPRKAFIDDLITEIQKLQSDGHSIILGGDFNESIYDRNSGLLNLISHTGLVDPWLYRHPHLPDFGTHQQGTRRIDLFLVSMDLIPSVQNTGYLHFHTLVDSDHRPFYLDLQYDFLFGDPLATIPSPPSRSVNSKDPRSVRSFVQHTYSHLESNHIFERNFSDLSIDDIETIDRIIGEAFDLGKRRTKQRRPEWFSPALLKQRLKVAAIRNSLSAFRTGIDSRLAIQARVQSFHIELNLPSTSAATRHQLKAESKILKEMRLHNQTLRKQAMQNSIGPDTTPDGHSRNRLLTSEQDQITFRIIRQFRQSTESHSSIDQLFVPATWPAPFSEVSADTPLEDPRDTPSNITCWKHITDPQEIQFYLTIRNRKHFGQAHGSPLTMAPLSTQLDWTASSDFSVQLLEGKPPVEPIPENVFCLFHHCQARCPPDPINTISLAEFKGKLARWNESTTTSPSGRHLGCYKSLLVDVPSANTSNNPDAPESISFSGKQTRILQLLVDVINWCIRHEYVLLRWRRVLNTMIFKEVGNYFIHRLRIIHIYEADYNLVLAVKWRRALRRAEHLSLLHAGQFGGRPGRDASTIPFLEELRYEIAFLTRRHCISFDNDAMSCYDRIIPALAALLNKSYGMNFQITNLHARALLLAEYFLMVGGISRPDAQYSHSPETPIYGTGQGSGNSPCIWTFISSTLFDLHSSRALGSTVCSYDNTIQSSTDLVGFVDDTTCICSDFLPQSNTPFPQLLARAQREAQMWSDILFTSGGRLELSKCSVCPIEFTFRPDGTPVVNPRPTATVAINDPVTRQPIQLRINNPKQARKTLGHIKAPNDHQSAQFQHLIDKVTHLSRLLTAAPVRRGGARKTYHAIFIPSTSFPLPQSYLSVSQLSRIDKASLGPMIAKMGYLRTTSRLLLFSPKRRGGAGLIPASVLQGEGQVRNFIRFWRTDSVVSSHLRIALSWAQFQAGISVPILSSPSTPIPYCESRWLLSLRTFLSSIDATLVLDESYLPPTRHQPNTTIMELAATFATTAKQIRIIQYCRLHLHLFYVTDLFDLSTRTLHHGYEQCRRSREWDVNQMVVVQPRPSSYQIRKIWRPFLRHLFDGRGILLPVWQFGCPDSPVALPPSPPSHEWQSQLLRHTTYEVPLSDLLPFLLHHRSPPLLLVSDGSVTPDDHIQFGWVLGTVTGLKLATGHGHGFGNPTSYRAEAYGMLAGVSLLQRLHQRYPVLASHTTVCASDSSSLIQALQDRQTYTEVYPNSTLEPEWDVREQIWSVLQSLHHESMEFRWVKGHQDSSPNQSRLSVIAKYNILADQLASDVPTPRPASRLPLPSARCDLILAGNLITSRYTHAIRRQAGLIKHRTYCCQRFEWSNSTYESIDWPLMSSLRATSSQNEVQLLKMSYDMLPTNTHRHKLSPSLSPLCSHCQTPESFDHLIRCPHPRPTALRLQMIRRILQASRSADHSFALQTELDSFWTEYWSPTGISSPSSAFPLLGPAIDAQSLIGWKWFIRGFVSQVWRTTFPASAGKDSPFVTKMLRIVWDSLFAIWQAHLDARHSTPSRSRLSPSLRSDLTLQIRALYDQRSSVLSQDRDILFPHSLEEFLATSHTRDLQQYLRLYSPAIKLSLRAAKNFLLRSIRPLTDFGFSIPRQVLAGVRPAEGAINRTHTRWRPSAASRSFFQSFFPQPQPNPR